MASQEGVEPTTYRLEVCRSIQLSYWDTFNNIFAPLPLSVKSTEVMNRVKHPFFIFEITRNVKEKVEKQFEEKKVKIYEDKTIVEEKKIITQEKKEEKTIVKTQQKLAQINFIGKKIDEIKSIMERDTYFSPQEAIKFGLIDKIVTTRK